MSSSDDDMPLGKANGHRNHNGAKTKSSSTIPATLDKKMDREVPSSKDLPTGISIRNGPVEEMDVDKPDISQVNGTVTGKRKSRGSLVKNYAEANSASDDDDDDKPLSKRPRKSAAKAVIESDSDDAPLVKKRINGHAAPPGKKPPRASAAALGESEDSDVPLETKLSKKKAAIEKEAEKEAKAIRREESKAGPSKKRQPTGAKKSNGVKKEDSDDEDVPLSKAKPATKRGKAAPAVTTAAKKGKANVKAETEQDEEVEAEEEEYRWWDDPTKGDGTTKWQTLEHNGVLFPPPYEPLPKNVKMKYDGIPVSMSPDAEEIAGFFGGMLNSTHNVENPVFQKNFFDDFKVVLKETGGAADRDGNKVAIKEFSKCDFTPIFEHFEAERARKKALSGAEKKALKAEKDEAEAKFQYCLWDGRKQKVGNFRVEPPSLFRGRGEHPKTGKVKKRVAPEQVTINIGKGAPVPLPPDGHHWKEVKHDQEGTWLAMWQENINGAYKYVMLAANSDVKGQSDYKKFEKARELKKHIDVIRKDYTKELKSKVMAERQRATAVYLIDQFALRAGNEKGEDEADTVGCCSLKFEHVSLKPPNIVIFDFLGKDSIRFYNEFPVEPQVFKNLKLFKAEPKTEGDEIFDRLTTSGLNKHLQNYMQGLTAKVFRTYNASFTMAQLLQKMKPGGSIQEKVKDYNDANREVAIICNHKRTVTANHESQMEKMGDRIKGIQYQKWRLKQMILYLDPKQKKKQPAGWFDLEPGLDWDWIHEHQDFLVEEQKQKIEKKFAKENEKLAAEGEKEMKQSELKERLKAASELAAKFKKENKSKKVEAEGKGPTVEKMYTNITKLEQRLENMALQAEDKENNKEVALGTSKINYIDPRLTVVFSKKFGVGIEKFFSKTLREKFEWAIKSADEDWEF